MKEKRYVMMIALATIVAIAAIATQYFSVYRYKGDAESLSRAISKEIRKDVAVIGKEEVAKHAIIFYKFASKNQVYGFAHFERGFNGRYRFANSVWREIPYEASILVLNYGLNVGPALFNFTGPESFLFIGGDNCDSIEQYGLRIENPITGEIELEKFPVESNAFLIVVPPDGYLISSNNAPTVPYRLDDRYALLYGSDDKDITAELFTGEDFEYDLQGHGVPLPNDMHKAIIVILAHYALIVYLIDKFRRIKEAS